MQTSEAAPGCDFWTLQKRAAEAIREIDPHVPILVECNSQDDPAAFACEAGCELIEVRPFYSDARRILKGKVGLYAKVAMAITDRTGRAFLLHMKL